MGENDLGFVLNQASPPLFLLRQMDTGLSKRQREKGLHFLQTVA
jgi:hypothetical protein